MRNLARAPGKCLLVFPALAGLAAGCATPAPIIRLAPRASNNVVWVAGRAAMTREKQGVRVAAAFDRQDEHLLAVRVEVENRSDESVEVDPDNMTYTTCTGTARETCRQGDRVIDPEGRLLALDAQRAWERADAANDRAAGAPLLFLGFVADVGNATNNTAAIANEALRRTTLFPGQVLAGTVYVPIDPHARLVWIQVEVGLRRFPFCFEQTVIRVGS
jgi:hypothetical protein